MTVSRELPADARPVPREAHDQHYPGEGEASEAGHDPDMQFRRVVEYPRVVIALSRATAAYAKYRCECQGLFFEDRSRGGSDEHDREKAPRRSAGLSWPLWSSMREFDA